MRNLFLHVGFAKCGSTSLQDALLGYKGDAILYPKSGINGSEHLSLALHIRGVDEWTKQFFDEKWVEVQHRAMLAEIALGGQSVVISSERLAAMSDAEIEKVKELFKEFKIQIIFVRRDLEKYLSSTWRHAVFYHDYAEQYGVFREKMRTFSFDGVIQKYQRDFITHVFDMDDANYEGELCKLLGITMQIPKSNVGVSFDFAKLLQEAHALLGSKKFKGTFDMPTKKLMLAVKAGKRTVEIDPLVARLF